MLGAPRQIRPIRPIVVLAAATVGGAIIEGAPSDWSAIQLERMGVAAGVSAAWVCAAFMAGMVAAASPATGSPTGSAAPRSCGAAPRWWRPASDRRRRESTRCVRGRAGPSPASAPPASSPGLLGRGPDPGRPPGAGAAAVSLAARLGFMIEPRHHGRGRRAWRACAGRSGWRARGGAGVGRPRPDRPGAARRRWPPCGWPTSANPDRQARLAMPPSTGMTAPVR